MFLKVLLIFGFTSGVLTNRSELEKYTRVAKTTDGNPCFGGCSSDTNECVINWLWMKKPCQLENEPAPIYYTSQVKDKSSKVCLSNCGKFGHLYEWCITTTDNKWDYCSSHIRGEVPTTERSFVDSYTKEKQRCKTACLNNNNNKGYWCFLNAIFWNVCAKQAISRVPTLPSDYQIGESDGTNCDAFLTNLVKESFRANVSNFDSETIPNNFLQEVADTIEAAVILTPESGLFKDESGSGGAVLNYTMTNVILENGTSVLVPAVIRAFVSKSTIRENQPLIDVRIMEERNRRRRKRQLGYDEDEYFNWRIIGYELGGSDEDYNFVRQSPNLYESWLKLQRAISKWGIDTGGSVEILVVIFYPDAHTTMPKGIGAAMSFINPDGSSFVDCKNTIYWNR